MERATSATEARTTSPPAANANGRHTFGTDATRLGRRIAGDLPVIACEPAFAGAALVKALELRRAGVHFALSVHLDDERARVVREHAASFCRAYATWDEVRLLLDQRADEISRRSAVVRAADRCALVEAIRLADSVIVRSWSEHARLVAVVGSVRRDVDIVVNDDRSIPSPAGGPRTDVVVYAPQYGGDETAPFATALGDLELPVTIVARDRPTIAGRVRFVAPADAGAALGRARVIVDAASNDPGVALSLARLNRPLVVSSAGGAAELLRGARTYDIWDRRSILTAAVNALGAAPPVVLPGRTVDRPPRAPDTDPPGPQPLVSVIVATYNRPALLRASLATIERQCYPNLEIIVVNDGGCDVRDVVARFPRARSIDRAANGGPAAARNTGLAAARGTFVMFFDDDDEMFPDHVAAHVSALDRSGLDVAYGQMINRFADPPGRHAGDAFAGHTALLDHADIQWAGAIAPTAVMFRRSLIATTDALDETLASSEDYDFWLRLADDREWARVCDITSVYLVHADRSSYSARAAAQRQGDAHRAIYAKHPTPRPLVHAGRAAMLQYFGSGER